MIDQNVEIWLRRLWPASSDIARLSRASGEAFGQTKNMPEAVGSCVYKRLRDSFGHGYFSSSTMIVPPTSTTQRKYVDPRIPGHQGREINVDSSSLD